MKSALRVALIYGVFGVLWIAVSDRLLEALTEDLHHMTRLQTLKGWAFVFASTLLLYVLVGREMRIRKGAEETLRRGRELLGTYHKTLVDIAKDEGLYNIETKAAFERITEAASRALAVQRVSIWFSLADQSGIRCAELFDAKQGTHSDGVVLGAADYPAYFRAMAEGDIIAAHDAHTDPRTTEFSGAYLAPFDISSMLDVPIRVSGKTVGVVCHEHTGPSRHWTVEEQSFVTAIAGFVTSVIEITEKRKLEEQLRQAQKMEAVGQLAGGVAHDFNNILTAVMGYAHLASMKLRDDDPSRYDIEQILASTQRAATLTQSLLAFSRRQPMTMRPVELNDAIMKFEKFLRHLIGADIELRTVCAGEKLAVMADAGQIEQALMNLVTNARDAMPRGGRITIETRAAALDHSFVEAHGYGTPGDYALITVSDTGIGMDETTRARIFEPFFTTKEQGRGTGLGLSMVYGIVKKHDGFINAYSEPGRGAIFKIYLPIHRTAAAGAPYEQEDADPLAGGSETILVAEDDEVLRNLTSTVLRRVGYTVIEARDGEEAVLKFAENKERISLALLDGIMPKKSGKEAYEELARISPGIKVVFLSGYVEDVADEQAIRERGLTLMLKPVSPRELVGKVREVLDR